MDIFENKTLVFGFGTTVTEVTDKLNKEGLFGWEVGGVYRSPDSCIIFLKRKKNISNKRKLKKD